ncbi:MAG: YcaO-like family protein [Euryarchaeota archaeon]|nr:YcaO-like family protein [Euryarchaeota archaeon]
MHAGLVSPRTGIVRRLVPYAPEAGDPPLVVVGSEVRDPDLLGGLGGVSASGAAGFDRATAEQAALGEACERYAAAFLHEDAKQATVGDTKDAVEGWSLFTERQYGRDGFPFVPWADDTLLTWVPVERLTPLRGPFPDAREDGDRWSRLRRFVPKRPELAPAQMVHLPFLPDAPERMLAPCLSTGLAAGPDLASAVLAGLYEVVERDAFTLAWLHDARPPRVREEHLPPRVRALTSYGTFGIFDITSDIGLPTFLCVLEKASTVGAVRVVGAATRHDADTAMEKAVVEAFQTVPYVRDLVRAEPSWRAGRFFEKLHDFRDHARFYTVHPEHELGLAHYLRGPWSEVEPTRLEDAPADSLGRVKDVAGRLDEFGLAAWWADLTMPDVAAAGYRVARVVVPGAQPLHGLYQAPHLGGARFRAADRHLPYLETVKTETEVNPWPHPFA